MRPKIYKSRIVFIQKIEYFQYDMEEFKKTIIYDLNIALNEIFCPIFLNMVNRRKEEIVTVDIKTGILTYLVKDKELNEYESLINFIFAKINMILEKMNKNQKYYYDKWCQGKWILIDEFKEEWFYHFF